jgi:hypothetical protein
VLVPQPKPSTFPEEAAAPPADADVTRRVSAARNHLARLQAVQDNPYARDSHQTSEATADITRHLQTLVDEGALPRDDIVVRTVEEYAHRASGLASHYTQEPTGEFAPVNRRAVRTNLQKIVDYTAPGDRRIAGWGDIEGPRTLEEEHLHRIHHTAIAHVAAMDQRLAHLTWDSPFAADPHDRGAE